ncbi:MAG: peptidylprolyl isomerase [Caulobacteraceae bacterium]|nr:peptidylprolyl isomerase [Caulobacteraceae bacterium]
MDFRALLRTSLMALGLAFIVTLAACNQQSGKDRPPEPGDVAVARVQGQTIWASDVKREAVAQGLIGEGEALDTTSDLFQRVMEEVIDQKLLAREAQRRGLDKSLLAQRRLAAARERILGDMLVESAVDNAIDENDVRALYNEQLRLAKQSEEIRARLILVKTKAEADAVAAQLASGAAFEAVAMERSVDQTTRFNGGDLGYFTTDVMPQSYAAALNGAPAGTTVGPFQTDRGWAILKVEDRRPEAAPTLEEARPQILRFLTYDEVRQLLEKLRNQARVEKLIRGDPLSVPGAPREPASAPRGAANPPPAAAAPAADAPTGNPTTPRINTPATTSPPPQAAAEPPPTPASDPRIRGFPPASAPGKADKK